MMKRFSALLLGGLLLAGCGTSTENAGDSGAVTDTIANAVDPGIPAAETLQPPKTFDEFLARYTELPYPYGRGKDDMGLVWTAHPENHIGLEVMQQFIYGTPGFPKMDDAPRYAYYHRIALGDDRWLLLTYWEVYGDHAIASIFDARGKSLDGLEVYVDPDDEYEGSKAFFLDENRVMNIYKERPVEASGETEGGYVRDTLRYRITDAGKFEKE